MKTKDELNSIKEEVDALNKKLAELNDEELKLVAGGSGSYRPIEIFEHHRVLFEGGSNAPDKMKGSSLSE